MLEVLGNDQEDGKGANASPEIPRNANHEMDHQKVEASRNDTEEYGKYEDAKGLIIDRRMVLCAPLAEGDRHETPGFIILARCGH